MKTNFPRYERNRMIAGALAFVGLLGVTATADRLGVPMSHVLAPTATTAATDLGFKPLAETAPSLVAAPAKENPTVATTNPWETMALSAKAAVVLDPESGTVIFSKNENAALPLASITKIMTALVASDQADLKNSFVTITPEALTPDGDNGLVVGETWQLADLINFSLVTSSNDGMRAIALSQSNNDLPQFIAKMNQTAKDFDLNTLQFKNETGLDLPDLYQPGAVGSALDTARLLAIIMKTKPELLAATRQASYVTTVNGTSHVGKNTNEVIKNLNGVWASKTGYTELSGGNLAIIFDHGLNQPLIAVVLGSTQAGRFSDMLKLNQAAGVAF